MNSSIPLPTSHVPFPPTSIPPANSQSPIFDRDVLTARCMGNEQLADKVLSTFLVSFGKDHDNFVRALVAGETETVRALAHRMRGASGNVAAERLRQRCDELEHAARIGVPASMQVPAEEVTGARREFQDFSQALLARREA